MIKIGVSSCFLYPDPDREVFSKKTLCYMENDMAKYLTKKQVFPVLIPDVDEDVLVDFISEMDGFVFQGGADIAPESYGESPLHGEKWHGDRYRDAYELRILDYAIKHHKPVLGICRG
ncbi:MAG: gamma-glutamyl-gamma-aminobutyrate hydrolase family protein, partial [Bacteroidetes bacterium]|nr:gamma-glutamyl-gamma-aminobutyrate hydrolase family protein [Bacteroidota bacterium]